MPTRRPHVVAVLPDSADAVPITRAAAALAAETGQPLALIVPVESSGFSSNALLIALRHARISADARAIAGRVQPTLDALGVSAVVHAAPYSDTFTARLTSSTRGSAVGDLVSALQADAVVLDAASPLCTELRLPAQLLWPVNVEAANPVARQQGRRERPTALAGTR